MSPEFAAFKERHDRACQAGLVAAAEVYSGAIKDKLQHGYTSGDFVTGATAASVNSSEPFEDADGWAIRVGSNEMLTLYWETGHLNIFSRKYERVEHWRSTMEEQGPAMVAAFGKAYVAVMGGEAPPMPAPTLAIPQYQGPAPAPDYRLPKGWKGSR